MITGVITHILDDLIGEKGLQIILTPPKSPELHLLKTVSNNYFIFVLSILSSTVGHQIPSEKPT